MAHRHPPLSNDTSTNGDIIVDIPSLPGNNTSDSVITSLSSDPPKPSHDGSSGGGGGSSSQWLIRILISLLIALILASPALRLVFFKAPFTYLYSTSQHYTTFMASLIITCGFMVFMLSYHSLPYLSKTTQRIMKPLLLQGGGGNELDQMRSSDWIKSLQQVSIIRKYLALAISLTVAFILTCTLMPSIFDDDADNDKIRKLQLWNRPWEYLFVRFIHLAVMASWLIVAEKAIIQRIAINFHSQFYQDRMERNAMMRHHVHKLRLLFSNLPPSDFPDENEEEGSEDDCQRLARDVFRGLQKHPDKGVLKLSDFESYLSPRSSAQQFFTLLDDDGNGDLTFNELYKAIRRMYIENALIERSLTMNSRVIRRLESVIIILLVVLIIYVGIGSLMDSVVGSMGFIGTSMIAAEFLFAKEVRELIAGIIFVIVTHPFDIGDSISLGKQGYFVEDVDLTLTTLKGPGGRVTYVGNALLAGARIANIRRSGNMKESVHLEVSGRTTKLQLSQLEQRLNDFVRQNPRDFEGKVFLNNFDIISSDALKFELSVEHKGNFQDGALKELRNKRLMKVIRTALQESNLELAAFHWDLSKLADE